MKGQLIAEAVVRRRSRQCVVCGQVFLSRQINALVCAPACEQRRWRACVMLAGTHDYVNGRLVRLKKC